ncbi:MAG: DUF3658 domain-containing protein [Kofleriaceae bacterium]
MLHVTFGPSACGSVIQAMDKLRLSCRFTYLFDDFSIGPLCDDLVARAAWFAQLGVMGQFDELAAHNAEVFAKICAADDVTIWMSRLNAYERCGFHEIVRRRAAPIHVIDIANHDLTVGHLSRSIRPLCFGFIGPDKMIEHKLHESAVLLDDASRAAVHLERRNLLEAEHAFLRVVDADRLISVPLTYFDEYIASFVKTNWTSHSYVVGAALGHGVEEGEWIHDELAWDRIVTMIESGRLEGDRCGEYWKMTVSKVRLRPT